MNDILSHYGVLGQKWGVRRYQDYDGRAIKDGIVVKKDLAFTRYSSHKNEKKNTYGKYASLTRSDKVDYLSNAVNNELGFKSHKNIYLETIKSLDTVTIRNGQSMVNDICNKIGDEKVNFALKTLKDAGYYDRNRTKNEKWKMYQDKPINNARHKVAKAINKYMKKNMNDILEENRKLGYDAIVDPEDFTYNYDMPVIFINDKKFKEVERELVPKEVEAKYKYKDTDHE